MEGGLLAYAAFYQEAYGRDEPVAELIPAMLAAFLEAIATSAERAANERPGFHT
ncbi:DUF2274 domain-containing protein [Sphingobium yanoikuyae]|uniref:DUF2274 domain-containing protein n=1 Tax=Sphingobium yanoikuyae TaxID=13690 RepID=UPI0028AA4073|nr:DUF2274 domain-containing protein [Sphingobium yanoikuyae]